MRERLGIFGAGGHAKVVADTALRGDRYEIHAYYDDNVERHGADFYLDRPIAGGLDALLRDLADGTLAAAFVAIGHNAARQRIGATIQDAGHSLATLVDPHAILSSSVSLGAGTLVVAGAIINADTQLGSHVIVNTGASVDHDCLIGDAVHIAPHATICGGVRVGARSLIGAAATIIPGLEFPAESVLGAAGCYTFSSEALGVYLGIPASPRAPSLNKPL